MECNGQLARSVNAPTDRPVRSRAQCSESRPVVRGSDTTSMHECTGTQPTYTHTYIHTYTRFMMTMSHTWSMSRCVHTQAQEYSVSGTGFLANSVKSHAPPGVPCGRSKSSHSSEPGPTKCTPTAVTHATMHVSTSTKETLKADSSAQSYIRGKASTSTNLQAKLAHVRINADEMHAARRKHAHTHLLHMCTYIHTSHNNQISTFARTMRVLLFPPRASRSTRVSREFRYGMCTYQPRGVAGECGTTIISSCRTLPQC